MTKIGCLTKKSELENIARLSLKMEIDGTSDDCATVLPLFNVDSYLRLIFHSSVEWTRNVEVKKNW